MDNGNDKSQEGCWLDGMPIQSENIAFRADEMITCAKCGKANPPNRASCIYCATPIYLPEERKLEAKLNLRPLENWEKGYNLVFVPPAEGPDVAGISRYLSIEPEVLSQMLKATNPFPIARIESKTEADIAVHRLRNFGLNASIVSDEVLQADRLPTRLREIEFRDGLIVLTSFNTGDKTEFATDELILIVAGSVIESKTETVEKRKKKETKLLHETATGSDEPLIDIYCKGDSFGFRVPAKGFDFSCLGDEKELLSTTNIVRLKAKLLEFSPGAKLVEEYRESLNVLSIVWDIDRQKDFQGLTRTGIGRSGFAKTARTSNLTQFTKYSRLQRHLL